MTRHSREMVDKDLCQVARIDRESYKATWSEADFRRAGNNGRTVRRVVCVGETVLGYVVYELIEKALVVRRLAVSPQWRRKYVGLQLASLVTSRIGHGGRTRVVVDVHERDLTSQLFLRSAGFLCKVVLPEVSNEDDVYRFVATKREAARV